MRLGYIHYARGMQVQWGEDLIGRVLRPLRVPMGGRDYSPPRQGRESAGFDGELPVRRGPQARPKLAVAPPAARSEPSKPPSNRASPASPQISTERPGVSPFGAGATAGLHAAWLIVLALLLGLALLSVFSDPPRALSPDEIARASVRTPHERANTGQY